MAKRPLKPDAPSHGCRPGVIVTEAGQIIEEFEIPSDTPSDKRISQAAISSGIFGRGVSSVTASRWMRYGCRFPSDEAIGLNWKWIRKDKDGRTFLLLPSARFGFETFTTAEAFAWWGNLLRHLKRRR